jgi:hypothetical protein
MNSVILDTGTNFVISVERINSNTQNYRMHLTIF